MKFNKNFLILAVTTLFLVGGCGADSSTPSTKELQEVKAQEAANSINFTENAEIDNIKRRLQLTSDPGLTGFVLLLNEAGQPIMYAGVEGKITSGSKRLTKPYDLIDCYKGGGYRAECVVSAPSDEGTHGSSSPYIYFWTVSGQYIQWNQAYLYSDQPFRLSVEPLVIDIVSE